MRSASGTGMVAAVMVMAASPAWALGPSFDCAKAQTPGAQLICSSPDLSATDLAYAQAYYALRQQVGESGAQALKLDAIAFEHQTFQRCGVPSAGPLPADKDAIVACVSQAYQGQRGVWMSRLAGPAAEEAARPLDQHIELQKDLQELGFLPAMATVDGVYGAGTRAAILAWQQSHGEAATGFLNDSDAATLQKQVLRTESPDRTLSQNTVPFGRTTEAKTEQSTKSECAGRSLFDIIMRVAPAPEIKGLWMVPPFFLRKMLDAMAGEAPLGTEAVFVTNADAENVSRIFFQTKRCIIEKADGIPFADLSVYLMQAGVPALAHDDGTITFKLVACEEAGSR